MPPEAKVECVEIPIKEIFDKGYWRPNPEKESPQNVSIPLASFTPAEKRQVRAFLKKVKDSKSAKPKKNDCACANCHCGKTIDRKVPLALCRELLPTLARTLEPGRGKASLVRIFLALAFMTRLPHDILYNMLGVADGNDVFTLNRLFSPKAKGKEISAGAPIIKKMIAALKLSKAEIHRVIYATCREEGCDAKILTPKIKKALGKIS